MIKIDAIVLGGNGTLGKKIVDLNIKNNKKILNLDLYNSHINNENYFYEYFDITKKNLKDKIKILLNKYTIPYTIYECTYINRKFFINSSFDNFDPIQNNLIIKKWLTPIIIIITEFLNAMKKKKIRGNVVMSGSIYGSLSQDRATYKGTNMKENIPYSLVKSGLKIFAKNLATRYGSAQIKINTVSPGGIYSKKDKNFLKKNFISNYLKKVPLKRFAKADEIAELYYFLGSEKNTYITGQDILIDGGYSIT